MTRAKAKCSHWNRSLLHSDCESNLKKEGKDGIDKDFGPFISQGFLVSLVDGAKAAPITILTATAAKQPLTLRNILPFSSHSYCGSDLLARGVEMSAVCASLHFVHLFSKLLFGKKSLYALSY